MLASFCYRHYFIPLHLEIPVISKSYIIVMCDFVGCPYDPFLCRLMSGHLYIKHVGWKPVFHIPPSIICLWIAMAIYIYIYICKLLGCIHVFNDELLFNWFHLYILDTHMLNERLLMRKCSVSWHICPSCLCLWCNAMSFVIISEGLYTVPKLVSQYTVMISSFSLISVIMLFPLFHHQWGSSGCKSLYFIMLSS